MAESFYQEAKSLSNPLPGENGKRLNLILEETVRVVDPAIKELLTLYVDEKNKELVSYQALTGGKRIRPALSILSCRLLGGNRRDVLYPAAGLEILHNYSLIIDDLIDSSSLRRGKPTFWTKFGSSLSQCIAIDYPAAAFLGASRSKKPKKIAELFAKIIKIGVDGEILDLLFDQSKRENEPYLEEKRYSEIGEKDYLEMVGKKTAILFQACCEVGTVCAGAKEKDLEALKKYGFNLGVAFQIKDDILDIFGREERFSKKIGKDITGGKLGNIVILFTLKELSSPDKERFLEIIKNQTGKDELEEAMELIKKTESHQKAYRLGKDFVDVAKQNLKALPRNKWNRGLEIIANFAIERGE